MKTTRITIKDVRFPFAFGESKDEKFFVPFNGRRKIQGAGKDKKFTAERDLDIRIKPGDVIMAIIEDHGKPFRCAAHWTTEEIWTGKPAKKIKASKKPTKAPQKPAPVPAVKAVAPEKIADKDERMLKIRKTQKKKGENPQLYYGKLDGKNGGLKSWIQTHGIPTEDFTFEVEKKPGLWVHADKEILGRLATKVVKQETATAAA